MGSVIQNVPLDNSRISQLIQHVYRWERRGCQRVWHHKRMTIIMTKWEYQNLIIKPQVQFCLSVPWRWRGVSITFGTTNATSRPENLERMGGYHELLWIRMRGTRQIQAIKYCSMRMLSNLQRIAYNDSGPYFSWYSLFIH
jgi:hypothetical protein